MLAALDCECIESRVADYVRGTLSAIDARAIDEHISVCADCQLLVDQQIVSACFAPPVEPSPPSPHESSSSTAILTVSFVPPVVDKSATVATVPVAIPAGPDVLTTAPKVDSVLAIATTSEKSEIALDPKPKVTARPADAKSLRETLLSVPWWVVSAAFHVLVIMLIGLISMTFVPPNSDDTVVVVTPLLKESKLQLDAEQRRADATALLAKNETVPTDPTSKIQCDVTVPADVLATANLSDHFETINPEGTDSHGAFGNPDAHVFQALRGDDDAAGGGGTNGADFDALIGAGGGATRGSGGGFGGGTGTGFGTDSGSGGGCFGQRNGKGREFLIKRHGGSPATEAAVDRALNWLARHQSSDGHWDIARLQGGNTESGGFANDECIAPLAVLAFLGAGHTPKAGKYKDNVKRGIDWIISRQAANGSIKLGGATDKLGLSFISGRQGAAYTYSEALATLALAEAYGMTNDQRLGDAAQRGINFLASIQESDGGWSHYGCKSTSVVGWVVMALKSAKIAKLNVPPQTFQNALKYLDFVTEKNRDGYYGLSGYGGPKQYFYHQGYTMMAVSMVCYQFMGRGHDTEHQAELLVTQPPAWTTKSDFNGRPQNFYHWYYGTLGMFQIGGESWEKWNAALLKTLLPNQRTSSVPNDGSVGDVSGSWDPVTTWDPSGGRVYTTAMGALCLEVYYRYAQVNAHK